MLFLLVRGNILRRGLTRCTRGLTSILVLALSNFEKTFGLGYDASRLGISAFFMQERCLVAYFSEKLSVVALNYLVYEKEFP